MCIYLISSTVTYRSDGPGVHYYYIFSIVCICNNTCHYNKLFTYLLSYIQNIFQNKWYLETHFIGSLLARIFSFVLIVHCWYKVSNVFFIFTSRQCKISMKSDLIRPFSLKRCDWHFIFNFKKTPGYNVDAYVLIAIDY